MSRYACNLSGECEPSEQGEYVTFDECQSQCRGTPSKDLRYSIYQFVPKEAAYLAPSDQTETLYRLTSVRVAPEEAAEILNLIDAADWDALSGYEQFLPYIRSVYQGPLNFSFVVEGHVADYVRDKLNELDEEDADSDGIDDLVTRLLRDFEFPVSHLRDGDRLNFDLIFARQESVRLTIDWRDGQVSDHDQNPIVPGTAEYQRLPADVQGVVDRNADVKRLTLPNGAVVQVNWLSLSRKFACQDATGGEVSCPVEYRDFILQAYAQNTYPPIVLLRDANGSITDRLATVEDKIWREIAPELPAGARRIGRSLGRSRPRT